MSIFGERFEKLYIISQRISHVQSLRWPLTPNGYLQRLHNVTKLWNKSRLRRCVLNLSVYLGNLPCVMSPEHSAVWHLWCKVLKYACIFSMRINVNIFTVRVSKLERLHIMALIYRTSLQQNSGRTLISTHRSVFINLDASVGYDQISR